MLTPVFSKWPQQARRQKMSRLVLHEAKRRILDSWACFYGAYHFKPNKILRETLLPKVNGPIQVWGTQKTAPAELAAWINGAGVRTLDYNDTYLSKEPCHPSDMLASLWAASQLSGSKQQGRTLLQAMVLSYEVMCRLCDAKSIRLRGWDHVTYLPLATAIGCSYILKCNQEQTHHAISLSMVGNQALRQTRVGRISDWKAACASYAARTGLWASLLARNGFTGPDQIFSGKNGFFKQVSGSFRVNPRLNSKWKIMETHTKFFPAEHHAQSAIEAAIKLRKKIKRQKISRVTIETFDVSVQIIGSEKEKWKPTTRETADHSMPYLVVVALLDGDVNLNQYRRKRFQDSDVRRLLNKVQVKESKRYSRLYPKKLPNRVSVKLANGKILSEEVMLSKGYAGRPMTDAEIEEKFHRLAQKQLSPQKRKAFIKKVWSIHKVKSL